VFVASSIAEVVLHEAINQTSQILRIVVTDL